MRGIVKLSSRAFTSAEGRPRRTLVPHRPHKYEVQSQFGSSTYKEFVGQRRGHKAPPSVRDGMTASSSLHGLTNFTTSAGDFGHPRFIL